MKRQLFSLWMSVFVFTLQAQQLAFPGAEGYGAYATGGRGGQVVHVTNLNAAGTGSLADAVSQSGRFVVFDVGGVIDITGKSITIASNVTIAGQTAPGEGITIYGGRVIASNAKNVIIRYIRMRGGKSVNSSKCTLTLDGCQNLIMDHCSVSWGPWDNVHIKDANNITWQYCINSEGIEPQRFGSITDGTRNWTIHHCLWANNKSRNPKMKCFLQYYNNVVYNYGMGIIGGHSAADNYQDVMNNYFIAGPDGSAKYFDDWTAADHLYSSGNYFDGNRDGVLNGTLITDHHNATPMSSPNFVTTHPMNVESAENAYYHIVDHVGASRVRDVHDKRILEHLTSLGTKGSFIANEDNVGGIGTVANGPRPADGDNDGMADEWESVNGLNPKVNDANLYTIGGGYTNIEHYVNSLAQKSAYIMPPLNFKAELVSPTLAKLSWTMGDTEGVTGLVLEQSEDGKNFTELRRISVNMQQALVSELTADKVYYFRMKALGEDGAESLYTPVAAVNDEYMRPAGGTLPGTNPFTPREGKFYRIISYATIPYNSGTTFQGTPKYLTFNSNGTLGSTESFTWDDPYLMWVITPVEGGVTIRNYGNKKYIAARNASIDGADRIGMSESATTLTINYTGDQQPTQSGLYGGVSVYRINSAAASNQQIRARGFVDDWFWGSGTFDRADMVFTFTEVDASRVKLFLTRFNEVLEQARDLANSAQTDVTGGYPTSALNALMDVVAVAEVFAEGIDGQTEQEDVDAQTNALNAAVTLFKGKQIRTFEGFSTELAYNIYSYGVASGDGTATASPATARRYLYALKSGDGKRDSLCYRIGVSENDFNSGRKDNIYKRDNALWVFEEAEEPGYVYVRSLRYGTYMRIERTLSAEPVSIYPYYSKDDNGKKAFFMYADTGRNRLFNVGNAVDASGGSIEFFALSADRTRLRWVIEETEYESDLPPTGVQSIKGSGTGVTRVRYFNLQGAELRQPPREGLYIRQMEWPDGSVHSEKIMK